MNEQNADWYGPDDLEPFLRPIGELKPNADNPRRGDVALVKESLQRFGQEKPVITDRDDHDLIVAGHHIYFAAQSLGWTHVAAIEMWAEGDDGARYLLMDNRTSDNSSYDRDELLSMLARYTDADAIAGTGFTLEERDQIRAELEAERAAAAEFAAGRDDERPRHGTPVEGTVVRNLLIAIPDDAIFQHFTTHLKVLQREWGITSNSECVHEALRREQLRVYEEGAE